MPEIRVQSLSKTFGAERALQDVGFEVHDHEFLTLLGPSGCGKTTTLLSIAGFRQPDAGRICCGERVLFDHSQRLNVAPEDRNLGIVFQSYAIWPHLTVAQNVAFPLKVRKMGRKAIERQVNETLDLVEMSTYASRYPHEISGGQQQRVALARALVYRPSVLLLDEPFSNLDAKLRERARAWVKNLQKVLGLTTVFVTHDQDEALSMSDRTIVMDHGVILQIDTPEEVYHRPATRFVAEFVGHCNILTGKVVACGAAGEATVALEPSGLRLVIADSSLQIGDSVELALRPEAIKLTDVHPDGLTNTFSSAVRSFSFLGDHVSYQLDAQGLDLSAWSPSAIAGSRVTVHIPRDACRVLVA